MRQLSSHQLFTLAACAPIALACVTAPPRPNVLFVTADDLGLQLGAYGETRIKTPRLDRLAAEGTRFDVAWVAQATCSPSRAAMLTGLYPHGNGQYGLAPRWSLHPEIRDRNLVSLLKAGGYRTGLIGKLHVDPEGVFPFDFAERSHRLTRSVRKVAEVAAGFFASSPAAKDPRPFFLMVNYSDPHATAGEGSSWSFPPQIDGLPPTPVAAAALPPWPFQGVTTSALQERHAGYLGAVERLDTGVGLLLDELERAGKASDTLVVFVGDHGPPFSRSKTTCYEAGLRVPFLVRWPGVAAAQVSSALVSTVDIVPTILDAAGLPAPTGLHGRSLRPVLGVGDPVARGWRTHLGAEFHAHGLPFFPRRAIRNGRHKLIHNVLATSARPATNIDGDPFPEVIRAPAHDGTPARMVFESFAAPPEWELYDVVADPHEWNDLAGTDGAQDVQRALGQALANWREETRDPFLDPGFLAREVERAATLRRSPRRAPTVGPTDGAPAPAP